MIAVCLMTCGRYDYTVATLESFARFNDLSKFTLLHADDASEDTRILTLVRSFGFKSVVRTQTRVGMLKIRMALIQAARKYEWMFLLENDCVSVRAFPWELFKYVTKRIPSVYCLRLFGKFKDAEGLDACKATHQWFPNVSVKWKRLKQAPEPAQIARIHWTAQPAVTKTRAVHILHSDLENGRHRIRKHETVRVEENVLVHIGVERTPGRML